MMSDMSAQNEIILIPVDIPDYPWGIAKKKKMPLSKIKRAGPPKLKEIGRLDRRNIQPRQRWFEENVLRLIAGRTESLRIPWRFRTPNRDHWQLDKGCVGHAMANGVLVTPGNPEQVLDYVELRSPPEASPAFQSDASDEVERYKRLGEIASRPEQKQLSEAIRRNYGGRCAVTRCRTAAALEAAHIRIVAGGDDNDPSNGILLRADIHALFDAHLITLTSDGTGIKISLKLTDPTYDSLRSVKVAAPVCGPKPSVDNIKHHYDRFVRRGRRGVED